MGEAEEDFKLKRWRSCVDNAQLAVENSGKAILMPFGASSKTREPAKHLAQLTKGQTFHPLFEDNLKRFYPIFYHWDWKNTS